MKVLITGASGFIGTNFLEYCLQKGHEVLNIDVQEPKIQERKRYWKKIDIRDFDSLKCAVVEFTPDYIVHLAARTDLDGKTLEDYSSNTVGVENLLAVAKMLPDLKKMVVTSSKLVNKNGYIPKDVFEYNPNTLYGESKVLTEKITWENQPKCDWCLIRPTSIWGPHFETPYRDFFDIVEKKRYFHFGKKKCHKTYGYIGNAVYQIEQLMMKETRSENSKVFYIGDYEAYEINAWADEIAEAFGHKVYTVPAWIIRCAGFCGDVLKLIRVRFPMTSFRYRNMTVSNVNDMSDTQRVVPNLPYTRQEGNQETIKWIRGNS